MLNVLRLSSIIKTNTFRQSGITFTFTVINGLLGMAFYIFLARVLRPSDFGLFSLSVVVLALTADIGNFGANTGLVNFVSRYFLKERSVANKYLKIGFIYKIVMGFVALFLGWIASSYLGNLIFNKPEIIGYLRIAFLGVGTTWLFSFTTSYYQASQKFWSWGMVQIFSNVVRFIGVIAVYAIYGPNVTSALIIYISAPLLGFFVSLINISLGFLKQNIIKKDVKTFFSFNKWIGIMAISAASSSRADTFILGRMVTPYSLGIYSAANQLVQVVPQLIGAIGTVVAPKFSSFDSDKKMLIYFKKLQLMVLGISGILLIITPTVKIIINIFFGSNYEQSYKIFVILFIAMLVFMISIPVHNAIIYYYQYPKLFSYLSFVNFAVVVSLAWVLTNKFGVSGTAYAALAGNIINFLIPAFWMYRKVNNKQKAINTKQ